MTSTKYQLLPQDQYKYILIELKGGHYTVDELKNIIDEADDLYWEKFGGIDENDVDYEV